MELRKQLGVQHEQSYLHMLEESGKVIRIPCDIPWSEAVAQTIETLQNGAGAIYQATFQNNLWGGRADFLLRVDRPSSLGSWSYEVVETKLMRSAKARALIQLCFYSDLLSGIQGLEPQSMHLVLGNTLYSCRRIALRASDTTLILVVPYPQKPKRTCLASMFCGFREFRTRRRSKRDEPERCAAR